jgi:lipopolysaccharide export system ATP-binding protein
VTRRESLVARGLSKAYRGRPVVRNLSIDVHGGEVVGLLGPNGAGKTTTFRMILGLEVPDAGDVRLGTPLNHLPLHQRARRGIGYLPQTPSVFVGLSVTDNLIGILKTVKMRHPREKTEELLSRFGLLHLAHQKAGTLSGGERRKLEFARAVCTAPHILLVDEPFAAVDPIAQEDLAAVIRTLASGGMGILLTDHSVRQSLSVCDRVYLIVNGEIVECGSSDQIRKSENARALYLGNDV